MTIPKILANLRLPIIGAPLFIISNPKMVIAQCKAGVVGSMPALNARPENVLHEWLDEITTELNEYNEKNPQSPAAPFAINQIVHKSNGRLQHDVEACVKYKVPIVITSLGAVPTVNDAIHSYGGLVFHDIINVRHAKSALSKGADGLIAVAAGAGGHAGTLSPFALIQEIREFFDGPLALSGSIATGGAILAARAIGADFAYIGSAFIPSLEANAQDEYKQMIVDSSANDIIYSNYFTGIHGNYLKPSIIAAGLDVENIPQADASKMDFASAAVGAKAWKDIWGSGQGIGPIKEIAPIAKIVDRLENEYKAAKARVL